MQSYTVLALWVDGYSVTPYRVTRNGRGVRKRTSSECKGELKYETEMQYSLELNGLLKDEIKSEITKNGLDFLLIIGPDDMKFFATEYVLEQFSGFDIEVSYLAKEDAEEIYSMLDEHFYKATYGTEKAKKRLAKPAKKTPGKKKKSTQPSVKSNESTAK